MYHRCHLLQDHVDVLERVGKVLQKAHPGERFFTRLEAWRNKGVTDQDAFEIVKVGGMVHDLPDYKYTDVEEMCQEIKAFLTPHVAEWKIDVIIDICMNVSFSTEVCGKMKDMGKFSILRHIVSDADKIEALGATGFRRCYTFKCKYFGLPVPSETCPIDSLNNPDILCNVVQHWREKLSLLYPNGYIRTEHGRRLAQPMHEKLESLIHDAICKIPNDKIPSVAYQNMLDKKDPMLYKNTTAQ